MELRFDAARPEQAAELTALLNAATLKLLAKDIMQWTYPWEESVIAEQIALGRVYTATDPESGRIAATFALKDVPESKRAFCDPDALYLYRIAVHPDFQGQGIGLIACRSAREIAKNAGRALWLDCWSGNHMLRVFYRTAGFEWKGDFPDEHYTVSVYYVKD